MSIRIDELPTPALVLDLAVLERNIALIAAAMSDAGVSLRPHFKTSKSIEVARRQIDAGAVGMTAATPAEVEALLAAGIRDVFWANSPAGPAKAAAAARFNRDASVRVGIDSIELADGLQAAAEEAGTVIPVLIEVDTGLGRTGVAAERARELADAVAQRTRLALIGVYTHEGQLAGMGGTRPELQAAGRAAGAMAVQVAEELRAAGHGIRTVSVGSTPGWDSAPFAPGVTEARPGTYVFFDANQYRLGSCELDQCALTLVATVVSTPRPGAAVIDAGIKAMSSDRSNRGDTLGLVRGMDATAVAEGIEFSAGYEEHGLLRGDGTEALAIGDRLRIVPNHACGITNMWSRVHIVDGDRVVGEWSTVARH